jgi:hypothetical protein
VRVWSGMCVGRAEACDVCPGRLRWMVARVQLVCGGRGCVRTEVEADDERVCWVPGGKVQLRVVGVNQRCQRVRAERGDQRVAGVAVDVAEK